MHHHSTVPVVCYLPIVCTHKSPRRSRYTRWMWRRDDKTVVPDVSQKVRGSTISFLAVSGRPSGYGISGMCFDELSTTSCCPPSNASGTWFFSCNCPPIVLLVVRPSLPAYHNTGTRNGPTCRKFTRLAALIVLIVEAQLATRQRNRARIIA